MGISVIMSVYDKESAAHLETALHSVWHDQTLRPVEIVLVEDGPLNDSLRMVVDKWQGEIGQALVVLHNDENIGLTKSLNRAIKAATQEYVARMDSDDISLPQRFELQAQFLDTHPDIDVVGGSLQEFSDECENLNVRHYPLTPEGCRKYIHKGSPVAHPSVMMRKRIFEDGLCYDERYRVSQDIALWFDVILAGKKICNIPDTVLLFRSSDDVFKRRGPSKARNEFNIYCNGIHRMYGRLSWRYAYPLCRYMLRMMPTGLTKTVYRSSLRRMVLERGLKKHRKNK